MVTTHAPRRFKAVLSVTGPSRRKRVTRTAGRGVLLRFVASHREDAPVANELGTFPGSLFTLMVLGFP